MGGGSIRRRMLPPYHMTIRPYDDDDGWGDGRGDDGGAMGGRIIHAIGMGLQ